MENTAVKSNKTKYLHIEIMRILAAYFVIFNHTGKRGFELFAQVPRGSAAFWAYLFISIFDKFAVPLFLAVSGALLLDRPDEPLKTLWTKRIPRIAVTLFAYSLLYYCILIVKPGEPFVLTKFLKAVYATNINAFIWYLYLYIAFLAVLPFLRAMVKNLDTKYFFYMFAIAVVFSGILPSLEYLLWQGKTTINANIKITWLLNNAVLYPCLGYFMQHRIRYESIRKHLWKLWLADIAGILISCYMTYYRLGLEPAAKSVQTFHKSFAVINCAAIYLTARLLFERREFKDRTKKLILLGGKCSFGIYLWHIAVKTRGFIIKFWDALIAAGINRMVSSWIICFIVMIISCIITLIQSRIPVLKKLVGF